MMQNQSDTDYIIYTDGGCAMNPGGPGGYGVVIMNSRTGEKKELSAGYRSTTNNRMEIMAVVAGLEAVEAGTVVDLWADSQYVLKTISGEFRKRKNHDLWLRLDTAMQGKQIRTFWIRGHAGDSMNERCDILATAAMRNPEYVDAGYENGRVVP